MRPIDADAYLKKVCTYNETGCGSCRLQTKCPVDEPTVDAVPVRHGKWIDETFKPYGLVHHPFKCNLCGDHAEFASPYCPNCGTRMDGTQKKPCDDCQQFDCYGCEYAERKEE